MVDMKKLREAVEVADSEMFTLAQYMKDREMSCMHGERFTKMITTLKTFKDLAEQVLAVKGMPEVKYAHTYASENAEIYIAHDNGQKEMLDRCILAYAKMIPSVEELDTILYDFLGDSNNGEDCRWFELATAIHSRITGGK